MEAILAKFGALKERAVASYGTPGATCHLGHLVLQSMAHTPDVINQIDAGTGQEETNASVLQRSVRVAVGLRKLGLQPGDVLALSGPNHVHISIPYFAAIYNGLPIMGVDPLFKYDEIRSLFSLSKPKVIFCQTDKLEDIKKAVSSLKLDTKIFTFDGSDDTMEKFVDSHSCEEDIEGFKAADFDLTKVYSWLVSTSGSTGAPKLSAFSAERVLEAMLFFTVGFEGILTEKTFMTLSPVQWLSGYWQTVSGPLMKNTTVRTSSPATVEHIVEIINKYKPSQGMFSPPVMARILKYPAKCDLTCFKTIHLGGSTVYKDVLLELKTRTKAYVVETYGQTECLGTAITPVLGSPIGSLGKVAPRYQVRLVDPETEKIITEPHVHGELQVKGPIFSEYYNDPEETAKSFTEDGWFKSGDILYRDENDFYYFVERIKMLIKYNSYHVMPLELEEVIRGHEDVLDVAVTGIPDQEAGELVVACVVKNPQSNLTAQEIKSLIANKLSDWKQLRGGVVFMDSLPMTSTGKIARNKLKELVKTAHRE